MIFARGSHFCENIFSKRSQLFPQFVEYNVNIVEKSANIMEKDSWTLIAAVGLGTFLGILPNNIIPFQIGVVIESLGFSEIESGILGTIEIATIALTTMLLFAVVARVSRVKMAYIGVLIAAISQCSCAYISDFNLLALMRITTGLGLGLVYAAVTSAAASANSPDRIYGIATAITLGLAVPLYPLMGAVGEWWGHYGFFWAAGIIVVVTMPSFKWLKYSPVKSPDSLVAKPSHKYSAVMLSIIVVLFNLGLSPVWAFIERVGSQLGLRGDEIGLLLSLEGISGMLGAITASWCANRHGRKFPLILAFILCAISSTMAMSGWGVITYVLGAIIYGYIFTFVYPFLLAIGATIDPSGRLCTGLVGLGAIIFAMGPTIGGFLASIGSYQLIGSFSTVVCTVVIFLLFYNGQRLECEYDIRFREI